MKTTVLRRITLLLLCLVMTVGTFIPAFSSSEGFTDIKVNAWYAEAVGYVTEKGIMVGTSTAKFSPDMYFSRAMTVQVLARLSGDDLSAYTTTDFPDVPEGKWYTSAVAWADANSIAKGDGKNFNPEAVVTREQLARMIHQFALKYEIENLYAAGPDSVELFADADNISSWAREDMAWVIYNGIISGKGNGMLDPKGIATRAEAAKIFYYVDYMKEFGTIPPDTTDFETVEFIENDEPRVVCWGDSMSQGYPGVFRKLYRIPTISFSAGGDTAEHMAMKQGALALYAAPFTIPAESEEVMVELLDYKLEPVVSLADLGGNGLTPVYIKGIKGALYYRAQGDCFYFKREEAGEALKVDRLTRIVTSAMTNQRTGDINIIYSVSIAPSVRGDVDALVKIQRSMIDYSASDKFVIIGYAGFSSKEQRMAINSALKEEYGDHFLDFGEYLVTEGFKDAGIEPTEEDLQNIEAGRLPKSFRSDEIHGNAVFDELLAKQLYKKLTELGYIEGAQ